MEKHSDVMHCCRCSLLCGVVRDSTVGLLTDRFELYRKYESTTESREDKRRTNLKYWLNILSLIWRKKSTSDIGKLGNIKKRCLPQVQHCTANCIAFVCRKFNWTDLVWGQNMLPIKGFHFQTFTFIPNFKLFLWSRHVKFNIDGLHQYWCSCQAMICVWGLQYAL